MKKIYVVQTEKGIRIINAIEGTLYTYWDFDYIKGASENMQRLFNELYEYQNDGYKIVFRKLEEHNLDTLMDLHQIF